jgi:hypothetical protein
MGILAVDLDHFKTGVHSYVMRPPRPVIAHHLSDSPGPVQNEVWHVLASQLESLLSSF